MWNANRSQINNIQNFPVPAEQDTWTEVWETSFIRSVKYKV